MSSLLDRTAGLGRPVGSGDVPPPSRLGAAAAAAARAVGAGLLPVLVPVALAWVLGAGGQTTWSDTVRFALALWLLAHHAGLAISGGHVGLVPLGLALAPLLSCWFAGRRLARTLDSRADRIEAGATRVAPAALPWPILFAFSGGYCVLACLASVVAGMPGLRPLSGQALVGAAVVSLVGGGLGAAAYRHSGGRAGALAVLRRLPRWVRPWLRPAAGAVATWIGCGAALVGTLLALHAPGVTGLYRALDAGTVGGAILTVGELALLPNLVIWACAATAGPGIVIGSGATVTVSASALGPLPAIPVLAALPAPGPLPGPVTALLAVPLLAGVMGGLLVQRGPATSLAGRLGHVAGAAVLCAGAAAALAWLSGGPAGPGRLSDVGPDPLLTGLAFGGEVALGAGALVLVSSGVPALTAWIRDRRGSSALDGAA